MKTVKILWLLLVVGIAWSPGGGELLAQTDTSRVYMRIEVLGLACPFCAYGMEKELLTVSGVEKVEIELEEGLAFISTPIEHKPEKDKLRQVIADAGFTPGEIQYSSQPFERTKKKKRKKREQ